MQILPVSGTLPRYSIATPVFRFRALAALAGRTQLGGDREGVLATLIAARLAAGRLPPDSLPQEIRVARAERARRWLGSTAVPPGMRAPLLRALVVSGSGSDAELADALADVIQVTALLLDRNARSEVEGLIALLRRGGGQG